MGTKIKEATDLLGKLDVTKLTPEQTETIVLVKQSLDLAQKEEDDLVQKHSDLQEQYKKAIFNQEFKGGKEDIQKPLTDDEIWNQSVTDSMANK